MIQIKAPASCMDRIFLVSTEFTANKDQRVLYLSQKSPITDNESACLRE